MKNKEVSKKDTGIVKYTEIEGLEGIEQDMLVIPRLKLVQGLSEEVTENDVKPGSICNSVTKEVVSSIPKTAKEGASLNIIPVMVSKKTRMLFKDIEEGGGILCQSIGGKIGEGDPGGNCFECVKSKWNNGEAPECIEFYNVFCLIEGVNYPVPFVASFGKLNLKAGRQLINFLVSKQDVPWKFKYTLSSVFTENDKGKFYVFKVSPAGKSSNKEIELGKEMYDLIKTAETVIDYSDIEKDEKTEEDAF